MKIWRCLLLARMIRVTVIWDNIIIVLEEIQIWFLSQPAIQIQAATAQYNVYR